MNQGKAPEKIRNIAELARMAGVSAGTVSRALANKTLVNKETRERIQALAREYSFRPNQMARRLRTQKTGVIGVVIPLGHERRQHISDPFFMTLFGYLADELTEIGYDLMLSRVDPGDEEWLDRIVDSGMLDGALVIGQSNQTDVIERVARQYDPLVIWGSSRGDLGQCTVGTDNHLGGRLVAEHLIARGSRNIAFLGDAHGPEIAERLAGAASVANEAGIKLKALPTHLASDEMAGQIGSQLDGLGSDVDGIVCASDTIAMTTVRLLHERGRAVPDEVAVTGFDDLPLATRTVPQLTTVRQDFAAGARAMVDSLCRRMAGEDVSSTVLPPRLVVRESA